MSTLPFSSNILFSFLVFTSVTSLQTEPLSSSRLFFWQAQAVFQQPLCNCIVIEEWIDLAEWLEILVNLPAILYLILSGFCCDDYLVWKDQISSLAISLLCSTTCSDWNEAEYLLRFWAVLRLSLISVPSILHSNSISPSPFVLISFAKVNFHCMSAFLHL